MERQLVLKHDEKWDKKKTLSLLMDEDSLEVYEYTAIRIQRLREDLDEYLKDLQARQKKNKKKGYEIYSKIGWNKTMSHYDVTEVFRMQVPAYKHEPWAQHHSHYYFNGLTEEENSIAQVLDPTTMKRLGVNQQA